MWGFGKRERGKEKPWSRCHYFIVIFSPIPFFNPSDEVCTGRGMLSQTAILLHHMCLTHWMAGRRGVCRERRQERGEGKKMKSRMGSSRGTLMPCDVLSATSVYFASARGAHYALTVNKKNDVPDEMHHTITRPVLQHQHLMQVNK